MNWLDRLQRKMGRFAIPKLMYILSAIMLVVYVVNFVTPFNLSALLSLDMDLVARGQIWRLVTFIFLPPSTSPLWIFFSLYFYCLIGNSLENHWGAFKLNVYYLFGMIGSILAALVTGYGVNDYLNLSLFLAFAAVWPDMQLLLFFFIPIKIKYLAILDAAYFVLLLIFGSWPVRAAVFMSLINVFLFFGGDFLRTIKEQAGYWKVRKNFRKYMK